MWYLPPGAAFFQNVNDQAIVLLQMGEDLPDRAKAKLLGLQRLMIDSDRHARSIG